MNLKLNLKLHKMTHIHLIFIAIYNHFISSFQKNILLDQARAAAH